jgi:myo-inositol-1(or 4)-monophosphatase
MVAAGNIELVIESGLNAFDIAPLIPIIEKAGGIVTSWDGSSAAGGGRILAAANRQIHSQAMTEIAKSL